jgi:hypothetical protein
MPRRRPSGSSFDTVRAIAKTLPGVEEGTSWGKPAIKLRGTLVACIASHSSAEPGTLVVRLGFDQRDAMIAEAPETYYVTPHYQAYACVLVRLAGIDRDALADLLQAALRFVAASTSRRRK